MAKPFKETAVGKFLSSKGFSTALELAGDLPGMKMLTKVKDLVLGSEDFKKLSVDEQQEFIRLHEAAMDELDKRLADVQNARSREVELAKVGKKDWVMSVVIMVGVAQWVLCVVFTMFYVVPEGSKEIFHDFSLTVRDIAFMIFAYYVGASKGGRDAAKHLMETK